MPIAIAHLRCKKCQNDIAFSRKNLSNKFKYEPAFKKYYDNFAVTCSKCGCKNYINSDVVKKLEGP